MTEYKPAFSNSFFMLLLGKAVFSLSKPLLISAFPVLLSMKAKSSYFVPLRCSNISRAFSHNILLIFESPVMSENFLRYFAELIIGLLMIVSLYLYFGLLSSFSLLFLNFSHSDVVPPLSKMFNHASYSSLSSHAAVEQWQKGCIGGAFSPIIISLTLKCFPSRLLQISHTSLLPQAIYS